MEKDLKSLIEGVWTKNKFWNFQLRNNIKLENSTLRDFSQNSENVIENLFGAAGKSLPQNTLLSKVDQLNEKRLQHIVRMWLLGILLYNDSAIIKDNIDRELDKYQKALRAHRDSRFPFVWFLIALYHDLGYPVENRKDGKYETYEKLIEETGHLGRRDGVPELYESMIKPYFEYRMSGIYKEEKKNDHGIVAGHFMYHDLCEIRNEKKKSCNDSKLWVKDLEEIYNLAAWVVTCHNIYYANSNRMCDMCRYVRAHLYGLMKEPQEYKINLYEYPLFFLLCLVDNIEFVKCLKDKSEQQADDILKQIEYEINDEEGYISLTVKDIENKLREDVIKQILGIGEWLTKVEHEEGSNEYKIYFINKEE